VDHPWPGPTGAHQIDYAHAEGLARFGQDPRDFQAQPLAFIEGGSPGLLGGVTVQWLNNDQTETLPADLVIPAIGFVGTDAADLLGGLGVLPAKAARPGSPILPTTPGVFLARDMRIGSTLVVHAIAEGRAAAAKVDAYLARWQTREYMPYAARLYGNSTA